MSAKSRLNCAELLVEEGNRLIKSCVKKMHIPTFNDGQQRIELGLKRKKEIEKEIADLEVKKTKTIV